ncbi:hypothetical protein GXM_05052 [Nostoc sphaeroides CCNUC1]|uniref:Uncharacterized protein n=1 Tax=Nostoc sphaeroides CCNUC1 TaxID=2653204 RepID=A0A5P8W4H7_9NOSO|nr:hypothetical protein GXM_05052 [Nostoc sphaeroides CCNUC1]
MNRQRSTVNNSNGIFFYLEVPKINFDLFLKRRNSVGKKINLSL